MTYVVAWVDEDAAYIVADTLATFDKPMPTDTCDITTFGESLNLEGSRQHEEAGVKIRRVDKGAFAFSGKVRSGVQVRDAFKRDLDANVPTVEAIRKLIPRDGPITDWSRTSQVVYVSHEGKPLIAANAVGILRKGSK